MRSCSRSPSLTSRYHHHHNDNHVDDDSASASDEVVLVKNKNRREVLRSTIASVFCLAASGVISAAPNVATGVTFRDPTVILKLETPQEKAGIALYDVQIGTPPRTVVAIQKIVVATKQNQQLQPGLILKGYTKSQDVIDRLKAGPYPIELEFYNLDSSNGELGEALTAQDALLMSTRQSSKKLPTPTNPPTPITNDNDNSNNLNSYVKRTIQQGNCDKIKSRRDDVLEINYEAHLGDIDGIIYDASEFRGTGRPYQMVLGSGDMIAGVDQGLVGMCPGEIRLLEIPPPLAYGTKGNKMFRIPPNTKLVWKVELVSVFTQRDLPDDDDE